MEEVKTNDELETLKAEKEALEKENQTLRAQLAKSNEYLNNLANIYNRFKSSVDNALSMSNDLFNNLVEKINKENK